MDSTVGTVDRALRQARLSSFGRVLTLMILGFVGLNFSLSLWAAVDASAPQLTVTRIADRPAGR